MSFVPAPHEWIHNRQYSVRLRQPRAGVMLHFDDSASDAASRAWFRDPRCHVSYNWLVLDDGRIVEIAPPTARAWHAGVCRPSKGAIAYKDANSAFYGVAAAAKVGDRATEPQLQTITRIVVGCFRDHGWSLTDHHRIVTHRAEAWPRGRRTDPEGPPGPTHPLYMREDIIRRMA